MWEKDALTCACAFSFRPLTPKYWPAACGWRKTDTNWRSSSTAISAARVARHPHLTDAAQLRFHGANESDNMGVFAVSLVHWPYGCLSALVLTTWGSTSRITATCVIMSRRFYERVSRRNIWRKLRKLTDRQLSQLSATIIVENWTVKEKPQVTKNPANSHATHLKLCRWKMQDKIALFSQSLETLSRITGRFLLS